MHDGDEANIPSPSSLSRKNTLVSVTRCNGFEGTARHLRQKRGDEAILVPADSCCLLLPLNHELLRRGVVTRSQLDHVDARRERPKVHGD